MPLHSTNHWWELSHYSSGYGESAQKTIIQCAHECSNKLHSLSRTRPSSFPHSSELMLQDQALSEKPLCSALEHHDCSYQAKHDCQKGHRTDNISEHRSHPPERIRNIFLSASSVSKSCQTDTCGGDSVPVLADPLHKWLVSFILRVPLANSPWPSTYPTLSQCKTPMWPLCGSLYCEWGRAVDGARSYGGADARADVRELCRLASCMGPQRLRVHLRFSTRGKLLSSTPTA